MKRVPHLKLKFIEMKRHSFQLHRMFREVKARYCKTAGHKPVLATKEGGKRLYLVTVTWDLFLEMFRALSRAQKMEMDWPRIVQG